MEGVYCNAYFQELMTIYTFVYHGHFSLVVCLFGIASSVLNVIVLSRRNMWSSPTNVILVGLAMADMLVLLDYTVVAIYLILANGDLEVIIQYVTSYSWTSYTLFHEHFFRVVHAVSIWLTVTLAVWRYLVVCWPMKSRQWCSSRRAKMAVLAVYVAIPLVSIPQYMILKITALTEGNITLYAVSHYKFPGDTEYERIDIHGTALYHFYFWTLGVLIKLVPCVALTFFSLRLVWALVQARRARWYLQYNQSCSVRGRSNETANRPSEADRRMERTTRMVMAVLVFFLVTEFPQGILALMAGVSGTFGQECYIYLDAVLEIMILINCAINFVLYCTMSKEFRQTFKELFVPTTLCLRAAASCVSCTRRTNNMKVIQRPSVDIETSLSQQTTDVSTLSGNT